MLFSFEQFATLNTWLSGFWRLIWLNILWTAMTLAGGVIFGLGPASYALATSLDRWFRCGQTPPTAAAFWRYARTGTRRSMAMGWVLLAVGAVIGVNLLSLTDWYLRMANFAALVVLLVVGAYVFFVLSAMDLPGLRRPLITALLLSIGSLHWTILGATAVGISYGVMYHFAIALLPLLGVVLPALVVTLILRPVFTGLAAPVPVPSRPPEPATP
ncbi:MAG TPA: DUF624 domain-containing protein [Ruania sp.]|nr:DUF624 domain-containing protein [Ruania sp.]